MIKYSAKCQMSGFPAGVQKIQGLSFTLADLARALFVTGRAPGDEMMYGYSSIWEFIHRYTLILAYLKKGKASRIERSDLALSLDRSEKVNLSYCMGQAMTTIFCQNVLSVNRLLHLDRYGLRYNVTFFRGGQRPDLIGGTSKGWVVAEAKGRSGAMNAELLRKVRSQKNMVAKINGADPWVAVGCVAEFPSVALQLSAFDPVEKVEEPVFLEIDMDRFMLAYYEPFLRVLDLDTNSVSIRDPTRRMASLGVLGLRIGILAELETRLRRAEQGQLEGLADSITAIVESSRDLQGSLALRPSAFADGSFFEVDPGVEIAF